MKKIKINLPTKKDPNNNEKKAKTPKTKEQKRALFDKILLGVIIFIITVGCAGLFYVKTVIDRVPDITMDLFESIESSKIYAADGTVIADLGYDLRENISYNDLPQTVIDAFVSIEDSRFFTHNGFDIPRFTKAAMVNLQTMSFAEGGSTITMQLVKNAISTPDKSIDRKLQDIYGAIELEKITNKQRILELYLNMINFGAGNNRGIAGSAEYFFGKSVSELTLSESALLAGIVNAPGTYSPINNLDNATTRRNEVLNLMVYHGYITETESNLAKSIKVEDMLVGNISNGENTPYLGYVNTVVSEVIELTGEDPYVTPMNIYTHMDVDVQNTIDAIQNGETDIKFPDELMQVSIVSMNNQTGEIIGIGGGRGDIVSKGFNRATEMRKQPGSAVKPFLSYALAFEYLGWATDHVVMDAPIAYRGTTKVLQNFSRTYAGEVTLPYAMGVSLNTPAYSTLEQISDKIGADGIIQYLNSLGFNEVTKDNFDLGYAIGGSNFTVTPVELTAAHAAMINGGVYIEPHTVSRIEFKDGSEPYVVSKTPVQVISEESAYLVSVLEEQNVSTNYANYMQLLDRSYDVFAKTGTSDYGDSGVEYNIPIGAAKDKWSVASSSKYTSTVWIGYDKAVKDAGTYFTNEKSRMNINGKINSMLLDVIHKDEEFDNKIPRPSGVTEITHTLGVFPYVAPLEGMNPDLITTGLINKDNAALGTMQPISLHGLSSFTSNATTSGNGINIQMNWSSYPDPSMLHSSDGTIDLSIEVGGKYYEAFGKLLYHPTWVYGPVRYKADIYVADQYVTSVSTTDSIATHLLPNSLGKSVKVCGYFAYESNIAKSNEICTLIDTSEYEVSIPSAATKTEIDKFITDYGLTTWTFAENSGSYTVDEIGKVISITANGSNIMGTQQVIKDLQSNVVVTYNKDITITLPAYADFAAFASKYGITSSVEGDGKEFVNYKIDGKIYNPSETLLLSQVKNITVVTKVDNTLELAKTSAIAELDAIDLTSFTDDKLVQAQSIINTAKTNVTNASTVDQINTIVSTAKSDIAKIV